MQYHYIYKTTLLLGDLSGKYYLGKRTSKKIPEKDEFYIGSGTIIKKYIEKYGKQPGITHIKEILEVNETKEINAEREKEIIGNKWSSDHLCINLKEGGDCAGWYLPGHVVSDETRYKQSISHIGHKASESTKKKMSEKRKGVKHTPEWCENIRKGKTGVKQSEEHKRKNSEGHKGIVSWNKGIPQSETAKQKYQETISKKYSITAIRISDGEEMTFGNAKIASDAIGLSHSYTNKLLNRYPNGFEKNGYFVKYTTPKNVDHAQFQPL